MEITQWILCPVCGSKTRNKIRPDTELKNFPLFCPKCKNETLIGVKNNRIYILTDPSVMAQSQIAMKF